MNSDPASDYAAGTAEFMLGAAEVSHPESLQRLKPLASLLVIALLSLGGWAAIWACAAALLR